MCTYCSRRGCRGRHSRLAAPRCRGSGAGTGWAPACPGRLLVHLHGCYWACCAMVVGAHTSLCDLGKGQARGALQVDVVRVDQGAQCAEGLAGEEVGFGSLQRRVSMAGSRGQRLAREAVHFRGSPADRRRPPARCRPARDHRCCLSSVLHKTLSSVESKKKLRVRGWTDRRSRRSGNRGRRGPWCEAQTQTFAGRPLGGRVGAAATDGLSRIARRRIADDRRRTASSRRRWDDDVVTELPFPLFRGWLLALALLSPC
jgi:hypothetical protein